MAKIENIKKKSSGNYNVSSVRASFSCSDKCDYVGNVNEIKESLLSYHTSYLRFGFTWCGNRDEPKPQCVLCYETIFNTFMKLNKLQRLLQPKHSDGKNKSEECLHVLYRDQRRKNLLCPEQSHKTQRLWNI